jgi:arabinogalactan endo-1,4-beta-galactosidase
MMRFRLLFTMLFLAPLLPSEAGAQAADSLATVAISYAIGADLSFLKQAEANGVVFKDGGVARPGLDIFRDHGYGWIRLRLFHSPTTLPNDLAYTIALAQDAQRRGMKFLLNYHYADSWADPGKQPIPKAWEGLSLAVLADSVYDYTRRTIASFRAAGVMPEMVQIGNETRNGMLWPAGKLPENWDAYAALTKAGIDGVDAGRGTAPRPLIMVHYDQGADARGARAFYDRFEAYGIGYDVIGLSYYPWWHGSLLELRQNLLSLVEHFDKDIIVVEGAYNWRPAEYTEPGALPPFPETPEGQRDYLESVHETLLGIGSSKIKGFFWWEPAVRGGLRSRGFFDDDGNALPVMNVFDKYTRGAPR